jgi:hypothetical protein
MYVKQVCPATCPPSTLPGRVIGCQLLPDSPCQCALVDGHENAHECTCGTWWVDDELPLS